MIFNIPTELPPELVQHPTDLKDATTTNENLSARNSKVAWIPSTQWLPAFIETYIRALNTAYYQYDLTNLAHGCCQYTVYNQGDFYNWHQDGNVDSVYTLKSKPTFPPPLPTDDINYIQQQHQHIRKLSFTLQLSSPEDYTGGELQLKQDDKLETVTQQYGMLTVFDSRISHRVRKVKTGKRISLVGWMIGPRWK